MTSRRERTPAGASNFADTGGQISSRLSTSRSQLPSGRNDGDIPGFRRLPGLPLVKASDRPLISHREVSNVSNAMQTSQSFIRRETDADRTKDILKILHDKTYGERIAKTKAEVDSIGEYNAFSKPRPSMEYPLRTVLLDPSVNNFPPCRTRTELLKKIRISGAPHPSYDLDHDGWVSQEDYRLAKRFDFDGNGVLDPYERQIGKQVMADEFFKKHAHELEKYGPHFKRNTHKQNVEILANSNNFERLFEQLRSTERKLTAESSEPIMTCMRCPDQSVTQHNYFVDKFDATAWNDFDAIPRSASAYGLADHGGSRKRLLFSRREVAREGDQAKLELADSQRPHYNHRRFNLLTNVAVENS